MYAHSFSTMRGNLNGLLTRAASLRNLGVGSGVGVGDNTNKRGGLLTRAASLRNVGREGAGDLLGSSKRSLSMHHVLETTDDETVFTSTDDNGKDQTDTRQTEGAKEELLQQTMQSSSWNGKDHADDDDDDDDEASLTSEIFQLPQATNGKDRGDNKWGSSYSQLSFTNLHHHSLPVVQCDINDPSNNSMILESGFYCIEEEEEKEISIHLGKKKQKKHQENDNALAIEKTRQPVILTDVSVDSVANLVEKKQDESKSAATTLKRQRKQAAAPPRNRPSLRRRNSTSDMGTTIRGPSSSCGIVNKPKSCSFESMNNTSSKRSPNTTRLKPSEGRLSKTEPRRVRTTLRRGSLPVFAHDESKRKNERSKSIIASSRRVLHNDGDLEKATTMPRLVTHQSMRDLSGFATRDDTTKTGSSSCSSRPGLMGRGSRSDRRLTTRTSSERRLDMDRMTSRRKLMTMRLEMCG